MSRGSAVQVLGKPAKNAGYFIVVLALDHLLHFGGKFVEQFTTAIFSATLRIIASLLASVIRF